MIQDIKKEGRERKAFSASELIFNYFVDVPIIQDNPFLYNRYPEEEA